MQPKCISLQVCLLDSINTVLRSMVVFVVDVTPGVQFLNENLHSFSWDLNLSFDWVYIICKLGRFEIFTEWKYIHVPSKEHLLLYITFIYWCILPVEVHFDELVIHIEGSSAEKSSSVCAWGLPSICIYICICICICICVCILVAGGLLCFSYFDFHISWIPFFKKMLWKTHNFIVDPLVFSA